MSLTWNDFSPLTRIFDLDHEITEKFTDLLLEIDIRREFNLGMPVRYHEEEKQTQDHMKVLTDRGLAVDGVSNKESAYQTLVLMFERVNAERMRLREKNINLMKNFFLNFSTIEQAPSSDFTIFLNKCLFLNYDFLKMYLERERENSEKCKQSLLEKETEVNELKNQIKKLEKELKNSRNSLREYLATGKCENILETISNELETQRNNTSPAIPPDTKENKANHTSTKEKPPAIETYFVTNFNDDVPATPNYSAFISDAIEIAESRLNLDFNPDLLFSVDPDTPKKRKGSANNVNPLLGSNKQGDPMRSSLMSNKRKSLQNILQQPGNVKIPLLGLDQIEEKGKELAVAGKTKQKGNVKLSKTCSIKTLESKGLNPTHQAQPGGNPEPNMKKSQSNKSHPIKKNGKTQSDQQQIQDSQKVKCSGENKDPTASSRGLTKKPETSKKKTSDAKKEGK